jgi:5-methylcytosine-specific restriction endonuclease McrA
MTTRREYRWREKPSTDKTSQKFGMLTVVGFSHYELKNGIQKGRKLIWDCLCKCGNFKKVENSNLIAGHVVSCGCFQKTRLKKLHEGNIKDDIAFWYVFRSYQHAAKKRKHEFSLSEDQFRFLTQQNCFYCGIEPRQIKDKNGNHTFKRSSFTYNGVDRKDNSLGYTVENCVSCCRVCNIAKATMTIEEFFNWVGRVCQKHQSHPAIKGEVAI